MAVEATSTTDNIEQIKGEEEPLIPEKDHTEDAVEVASRSSLWSTIRHSKRLVVVAVFGAMMLDLMIMTSIDPLLPEIFTKMYGIEPIVSTKRVCINSTNSEGMLFTNCSTTTTVTDPNDGVLYDRPYFPIFHGNMTQHPHNNITTKVGIVVAAKPATEIVANILVGCLVDRFGHRYPMLFGFAFNTAATLGFAYAPNFELILAARVCQAIASSLSVVSGLALIAATFTDEESRSKAISTAFGGLSLGVILGYPFGSTSYQFLGRKAPFIILASLSVLDGILRLIIITPKETIVQKKTGENQQYGICRLLADPYILVALLCNFAPNFGLGVFLATGPYWMRYKLGAEQWQIGVVLSVAIIWQILAQCITGAYSVRFGRWKFCIVGLWFFSIGMACYPFCKSVWAVVLPELAVRIGHGTTICTISPLLSYLSDIRHSSNYGGIYGLYTASYNIGLTIGPTLGGAIVQIVTFTWLFRGVAIFIALLSLSAVALRNPPATVKVTDRSEYETIPENESGTRVESLIANKSCNDPANV